jgi:uncharacterized membrane protein YphA (DoxX/SURF4 family)
MIKIPANISRIISNNYVMLAARLLLGGIFIFSAVGKIPEGAKFVDVVTGLGLLPWNLAQVYGTVLPWLELTVGICLLLGIFPRFCAGVCILMITSFIIANGTAVYEYKESTCGGCFGDLILLKTSDALAIDIAMILLAIFILLFGGGKFSIDSLVRLKRKEKIKSKSDIEVKASE